MKIDIHTHTKKCKSGDAPTREISPEKFCEIILSTDVKIIAITNHNVFDLEQFIKIENILGGEVQAWPGIEIDVSDGALRGHLLVIVSPGSAKEFSASIKDLTKESNPDDFIATIDEIVTTFEHFDALYVAHYKQKKPNFSDEALYTLQGRIKNSRRLIKEVTNSISAGIYISHGNPSIYGSDIQDWSRYAELSHELPDLRLPVDSFEHFCLLLEKDSNAINTVLDRKSPEDLILYPFNDNSAIKVRAFNDINVIFGSKGTGKSCILKAIARHYSDHGIDAQVYESASDRLDEIFDIKGKDLTVNLNLFGIDYCLDEIKEIRSAGEVSVTSLSKYVDYFSAKSKNRNAKKILLKDIEPQEEVGIKKNFLEFSSAEDAVAKFQEFFGNNIAIKNELDENEFLNISSTLSGLKQRLKKKKWTLYSSWKEVLLLNSIIKIFRREVERKTGNPANPIATGFRDYAKNRIAVKVNAAKILKSIDTSIPIESVFVGSLGLNKGDLKYFTEFKFQNGSVVDGGFLTLQEINKKPQKTFANCIRAIYEKAYENDLFQSIAELNAIENVEDIKTVLELVLFKRYFSLNGQPYSPSSGEASMVMLQKELATDKEVYILDEPERSLGNDYINDVIVPIIKERAQSGKRIFISTHDANIAVRTLPYSSVYRCYGKAGYSTYIGNPFTNDLINPENSNDRLDWKNISMRTLEGGADAFGERGKIYGNS